MQTYCSCSGKLPWNKRFCHQTDEKIPLLQQMLSLETGRKKPIASWIPEFCNTTDQDCGTRDLRISAPEAGFRRTSQDLLNVVVQVYWSCPESVWSKKKFCNWANKIIKKRESPKTTCSHPNCHPNYRVCLISFTQFEYSHKESLNCSPPKRFVFQQVKISVWNMYYICLYIILQI